jgi:hypothetical protein
MGQYHVDYHFPESGRSEYVFFSAFLDYRLEDGTKLHVLQQAAWCPACGRFVLAEALPSVDEMEEEITRYRSGDQDALRLWAFASNGTPVAERIGELLRRIEFRRRRRTPSLCLECGGSGTIPIPISGEFFHPQTGEKVVVGDSGFSDLAPWSAEYSPEGERLAESAAEPDSGMR